MSRSHLVINLAYGYGSWGDEMVLDGALNLLGRERCVVFSADPPETRRMHQVEAIGNGDSVRCESVHVAGGGWGYPSLVPLVAATVQRLVASHRVLVEAAGFRPEVNWAPLADTFAAVAELTVRDPTSQEVARRWFRRDAEIAPDLSMHMGVNPVDLPPGPWVGVNIVNQVEPVARLLPLLRQFLRLGYRLVALPTIAHKEQPQLDGHAACRGLAALLGSEVLDVEGPWYKRSLGPRELAGVAANCRYIVAMRKHGCYLAARVGVPVLMCDWFADHGLPHRLRQLRDMIPDALYCDLHAGDDPLAVAQPWLREEGSRELS